MVGLAGAVPHVHSNGVHEYTGVYVYFYAFSMELRIKIGFMKQYHLVKYKQKHCKKNICVKKCI